MIFKSKNRPDNATPNLLIDGHAIDRVQSTKLLGILLNSSLTWTDHITLILQKISKTIGILKYVRNKLSTKALKSIYFALVHPYYKSTLTLYGLEVTQWH